MKSWIVVHSYHHGNSEKIARSMAEAIDARVTNAVGADAAEAAEIDLLGLGAGIDSGAHYQELLNFAMTLPEAKGRACFLFSTCGICSEGKMASDHARLSEIVTQKGYRVLGGFACVGYNTNSFLKYLGGMNRGRPNAEDCARAAAFARTMAQKTREGGK